MVDPTVYRYLKDATSQTPATKLVVDLQDGVSTTMSGSITSALVERSTFDENLTQYALYPYELNLPPIIVDPILEASEPKIYNSVNWVDGQKALYQNDDGAVIVAKGTAIVLRVNAQQPDTLNVENGIPTTLQDSERLNYTWTFNGVEIPTDVDEGIDGLVVDGNALTIESLRPTLAGTYVCAIANDSGVTSTNPILLQVFDPYSQQTDFFRKNIVVNPTLTDGTSGWTNAIGEILKRPLITPQTPKDLQHIIDLKKITNISNTGFAPEMFEPQIDTVDYVGIDRLDDGTPYTLEPLRTGQGGYVTRNYLTYGAADGKKVVVAYQDLDLSTIQDHIAGKIWGIDGVKAYFACYLGNSVSSTIPTEDVLTTEERGNSGNYYTGAPRLTLENMLLSGLPFVDETLTVYIQEYYDNELLASTIYDPRTGQKTQTTSANVVDPITEVVRNLDTQPAATADGFVVASAQDPVAKIAKTFKQLYGNESRYYTNGQVVKQRELVFDKLNSRTNKVRISLKFELNTIRFEETEQTAIDSSRLLEMVSYERVYKKGLIERGDYALAKIRTKSGYDANTTITKAFLDASLSRVMATAFTFVTNPIVSNDGLTKGNSLFANNIKRVRQQMDYDTRATLLGSIFQYNTSFLSKYLGNTKKPRAITYEAAVNLLPLNRSIPSWVSPTDWRNATQQWEAQINVLETDLTTGQTSPSTDSYFTAFEQPIENLNSRYYNQLNSDITVSLANPSSQFKRKGITKTTPQPLTIRDVAISDSGSVANYLTNAANRQVSQTTLDLRKWIQSDYYNQISNTLNDNRRLPLANTLKVTFDLLHWKSGTLTKIASTTKTFMAGKQIKLTFADFIPENAQQSSYEFAAKSFTGARNVYVVPTAIEQVFQVPVWNLEDHEIAIPNLKDKIIVLIDGSGLSEYYKDALKDFADEIDGSAYAEVGTIRTMINKVQNWSTDIGTTILDDILQKLTDLKNNEGYQPAPPGYVTVQEPGDNIIDYIQVIANTPVTGLLDIVNDSSNGDVFMYNYKLTSTL